MVDEQEAGLEDLLYDAETKTVGCVLLQAIAGCDSSLVYRFGFKSSGWITHPTPGLKRYSGTREEWEKLAEISNRRTKHGRDNTERKDAKC